MIGRHYNVKLGANVPGLPVAYPGRRILQASDYDHLKRKERLSHLLPFYNKEELARRKYPYYIVLLNEMMEAGYKGAVQELAQLFRKEEKTINKSGISQLAVLVSQHKKVYMVADILRASEEYETQELYETAATVRRELGQKFMKEEDDVYLAKYFLRSALTVSEKEKNKYQSLERLQAEIHCLLAFIARDFSENLGNLGNIIYSNFSAKLGFPFVETALESAVHHLAVCRELSKDQSWHFTPHILSIRIKKPISLHGLREDYETIDACSMSLYMIATLLEHEMMLELANQILHSHKYPLDQDIAQAHVFADSALKLAFEVHQPVALSSALLRFGIVLRHAGEYDDAIKYFKQLSSHSEVSGDYETVAIAQHNIAMTHMAKHESMEALECLTRQKEIADMNGITDLQADALEELGLILLQEGQLWESEECYSAAYDAFKSIQTNSTTMGYRHHCERNFGMWGIAAGHQLWSRFAGLARSDEYESIAGLVEWKSRRATLPKVPRPDYTVQRISDVYKPYHLDGFEEEQEIITPKLESKPQVDFKVGIDRHDSSSSSTSDSGDFDIYHGGKSIAIPLDEFVIGEDEYVSDFNHTSPQQAQHVRKEIEIKKSNTNKTKIVKKSSSRSASHFGSRAAMSLSFSKRHSATLSTDSGSFGSGLSTSKTSKSPKSSKSSKS